MKSEENEDKVNELLDNLDINTYEKNYAECVQFYKILYDMRNSKTFIVIL